LKVPVNRPHFPLSSPGEERAGERRFCRMFRKLPLSPALSPLVPRREREKRLSVGDRQF